MSSSETSRETYRPAQYNNPEDGDFKCKIHLVFDMLKGFGGETRGKETAGETQA
jgi:hypothetical protein